MKKILTYISILWTSATFNGCYDLNTYPGDKLNENLFYKTEEHAKQGLMGIMVCCGIITPTVTSFYSITWLILLMDMTII